MRIVVVLVVALVVLVWARGFSGPYHFDDDITPRHDPASASLGAFVDELPRTIRPLTKLTYAIEASAGLADEPAARRGVTAAMLAIAAVLVALLVRRLVPGLGILGAMLGALIFALHPVHAEGVLAVAGRTAVLSGALVLGALYAASARRPRASGGLLLLAMLARETAIAAVIPLLAVELTQPGAWRDHARRLAPVGAAVVVMVAWLAFTPRYRTLAEFSLGGHAATASRVAQVSAVPEGLALYARVDRLTIDHGEALARAPSDPRFVLGLALFGLAAVITVWAIRKRQPAIACGAALWLAAILPTQSLIPKLDALTERPLELALAGLVLALAPAAAWIGVHGRTARVTTAVVTSTVMVAVAVATLLRGPLYRSDLALWGDAAAKASARARPHYNYGIALEESGARGAALVEMRRADALEPFDPDITHALTRLSHRPEETP